MKSKLSYPLLLILTVMAAACSKQANTPVTTDSSSIPKGNFLGNFTLIHKNSVTSKLDTSTALITVSFVFANATYSVAGDTSKIQAGSRGSYSADGTTITFTDMTVTKKTSLNAPKKHLNGQFLYTYDGTRLIMYGASDTLSYNYNLQSF